MEDSSGALERARAESAYYKRQLDELTAITLKHDYRLSSLQHQLKQRRQGFALLSELSRRVGGHQNIGEIFKLTVQGITSTLGMDRALVLSPGEHRGLFHPSHWVGFPPEECEPLSRVLLDLPTDVVAGANSALLVNKATPSSPIVERIVRELHLPYFVLVPALDGDRVVGVLLAGRMQETMPRSPRLDDGDLDTFRSISGLISAQVRNMRVGLLEEMDRLKTEFFANISHEFRTPITLTVGPLRAIQAGRYGGVPAEVGSQIDVILRNQNRLLTLINRILDLSKLEARKMLLRAQPQRDVNRFVSERAEMFRSLAESKSIELRIRLESQLQGLEIFFDSEKMDEVLSNLLSNAFKFTSTGYVEVATEGGSETFSVRVTDTGAGIPEDQLPFVFDRFRQVADTSRDHVGTGIGLALVKQIVELHGGTLTVHSRLGSGTTFNATFPIGRSHLPEEWVIEDASGDDLPLRAPARRDSGDSTAEDLDRSKESPFDPRRPTVLYVDDNSDLRRYVRDLLAPHYNVFLAVDGRDGLEKARQHRPDVILSDLMMPHLSGTEFCRAVRQDPDLEGLPFVLLTAKSSLDDRIEGLEEGADDYLSKPFAEAELLARARNLVRIRKMQVRLKRELQAARGIQRALLPPSPQAYDGVELDVLYHPSSELSGDFFDYLACGPWVYFYLADVTSHGTASAQVSYLVRGLFREVIAHSGSLPLDQLMAAVQTRYAVYDLEFDVALQLCRYHTQERTLEGTRGFASPPILVRRDRYEVLKVPPGHGLSKKKGFGQNARSSSASLEGGDLIFLATDGCYEFHVGGRPFGLRRLCDILAGPPGPKWTEEVLTKLSAANQGGTFEDDLTVLRFRVEGAAE